MWEKLLTTSSWLNKSDFIVSYATILVFQLFFDLEAGLTQPIAGQTISPGRHPELESQNRKLNTQVSALHSAIDKLKRYG